MRRSLFLFKLRFKILARVRTAFYLFEWAEAFPPIFGSCSLEGENDIAATAAVVVAAAAAAMFTFSVDFYSHRLESSKKIVEAFLRLLFLLLLFCLLISDA